MEDIFWILKILITYNDETTDSVSYIKDPTAAGNPGASTRTEGNTTLAATVRAESGLKRLMTDLGFTPTIDSALPSNIKAITWRFSTTITGSTFEAGSNNDLSVTESNDIAAVRTRLQDDADFVTLATVNLGATAP